MQPLSDQLSIYVACLQMWFQDELRHGDIIPAGQEVRGLPHLAASTNPAEHRDLILLSRWLQVCRGTMSAVSLSGELSPMVIFIEHLDYRQSGVSHCLIRCGTSAAHTCVPAHR